MCRRDAIKDAIGGAFAISAIGPGTPALAKDGKNLSVGKTSTKIIDMPAWELSQQIHAKNVSCVEVMAAYLAQADKVNATVNAFVARQDPEGLLKHAREKDELLARSGPMGWMHGFPQAIKDLSDTAGITTTYGSPSFKNNVPKQDSMMVHQMKDAGCIIVAKTNTPEWGYGSHTYNPVYGSTGNAYDPTKSAGGSSGGAAVSLALHMQPVADGSDYMGSLRNPAGWNCVFGYRPSWGRIPSPRKDLFINEFGISGPMGRSISDVALLLATQSGYSPRAPASLPKDENLASITPYNVCDRLKADHKGKKIAWLGNWNGYLPMEDGVLETCEKALKVFESMGMRVESIKNPADPERLWNEVWLPNRHFSANGQKALMENPTSRALAKPEAIWEYEGSKKYSSYDVYESSVKRSEWYVAMLAVFDKYDFIVAPTAQMFPFDREIHWPKEVAGKQMDTYHRWMEVVTAWTMSGNPVAALPAGFNSKGLCNGIQLIGRPRGDWEVLRAAYAYELVSDIVNKNRPVLAG